MSTPRLRLVLDTNVLVAALLTPGRTPDRALSAIFARGDVVLYDASLEAEYRAVLARPKFRGIDPAARGERCWRRCSRTPRTWGRSSAGRGR
jgi:predicted nucleic acid-binding protein